MADWKDNKGSGPWDFTPSPNKWGYLNNPLWSGRQDAIDFSEDHDLPLDLPDEHKPCGHWHKVEVSEEVFPAGRWVAAMQQPGTPYIYVYDILYKAVIRIDTSEIPVFVESVLKLDSAYALDYDMGYGNPGGQRGAYCMNKDATRIWYLFCDQGLHPVARDHPDAQLIEVDISKTVMRVVKRTSFPGLLPAETFPDPQAGRVNDGCSDDTHTYWCTDLIAGRIIKIGNSDHSIIDDHTFNYPLECGGGGNDESIATIDYNKNNEKLYWIYVRDNLGCAPPWLVCRHLIRSNVDLAQEIDDVICSSAAAIGNPAWQNMIRVYANVLLHHRAYHPSFDGHLMKRGLDCIEEDEVEGSDTHRYACIKSHYAAIADRPITGANWTTYWIRSAHSGGNVWSGGQSYTCSRINLEYLQNIFGIRDGKVFTLMHVNSAHHPARLYCINFSDMTELSNLDISYYAGQIYPPGGYDWDWTSVSAMNYQTGVIAIFRYHNLEERNYVGCFEAKQGFGFLCDVPLHFIKHTTEQEMLNEPQSWPFEGFTPPEIPEEDPPIEIILPPDEEPGPGEIIYEPPPPPPDDAPDNVPILASGYVDYMHVGPGETIFFKIIAAVPECVQPIQVGNAPQSNEPRTVHLLMKRGSKPTIADFERTWVMAPSYYDCTLEMWMPAKPGAENLYWLYNLGSATEFVQIKETRELATYYIMLYNNGTRSVRNQRLTVSYWV